MHIVRAGLVGRTLADDGLAADQGRLAVRERGLLLRLDQGGFHRGRVVAIHIRNHMPAVGGEARRRIVGEPAFDMAVDRDAVVIVEGDQLGQTQRSGQRAGLVADALHHAAITQERIGVVVNDVVTGVLIFAVEFRGQQLLGQRHAHGIGDALAQWTGGGFHARRHAHFGVTGGLAVQLAETLDLRHRQVVAGQVQQRIEQHGAVAVGQHEAVAIRPVRVDRVVLEVAVPQHLGDVGHAHGGTRVAGLGLFDGVHRQHTDGIGHLAGEFWRRCAHAAALFLRSIMRQTNGVKINCMASSILPPGTTTVLARDMKELSIMLSR